MLRHTFFQGQVSTPMRWYAISEISNHDSKTTFLDPVFDADQDCQGAENSKN